MSESNDVFKKRMSRRQAISSTAAGAIAGVVVGGLIGYFSGSTTASAKTVTETVTTGGQIVTQKLPDPIKIGVMCDLSGPIGPVGSHFYKGAELATKITNDTGGIGGSQVRLILEDTKSDPQVALEAARKLIEIDGVQVIVGPITSVATLTIASYVNDRKVPIIATIATSPKITQLGDDYVFRVAASNTKTDAAAAVDFFKDKEISRLVTFVVTDDYGMGVEEFVKGQLGGRVVASIRIDPKMGDFRAELERVKAANPDAILWTIWIENAQIVFRQAMDMGLSVPLSLSGNTLYNKVLFEDPKTAEFTQASNLHVINEKVAKGTHIYDTFSSAFKAMFNEDPWEPGAKAYYDACMLAMMAIAKAGAYDGQKIKESLISVSQHYLGPSGFLAFDRNGDRLIVPEQHIYKVGTGTKEKYEFQPVAEWDPLSGKVRWYR
ncbi:MAG: ABC transporter substrate-binding protein [Candidatus Caldarchaeum sp.]